MAEKDGILTVHDHWVNGRPHGLRLHFHDDGQPSLVCNLVHGRLHGDYMLWGPGAEHELECHVIYDNGEVIKTIFTSDFKILDRWVR